MRFLPDSHFMNKETARQVVEAFWPMIVESGEYVTVNNCSHHRISIETIMNTPE